jgi:hypothetical protein
MIVNCVAVNPSTNPNSRNPPWYVTVLYYCVRIREQTRSETVLENGTKRYRNFITICIEFLILLLSFQNNLTLPHFQEFVLPHVSTNNTFVEE